VTPAALFVLCLLAECLFPRPRFSHAFVNLFTAAPTGSVRVWLEGLLATVVFGEIGGVFFAFISNAAARP